MKKRILSVLLILCMVLAVMPTTAFAADGENVKSLIVKFNANGGTGAPGDMTVQASGGAFRIIIPDTVPTRDGYHFKSWSKSQDRVSGSYEQRDLILINEKYRENFSDFKLYAVWETHVWNDGQITQQPTCTVAGEKRFTCTKCSATKTEDIPAIGHSYGAVTYIWSVDNQKCTAERKCTVCDDVERETADATATVIQEKSCTLPELTTYSATFKNDAFSSQKKESVQTADAAGHDLEKAEKKAASCTEAGYEEYWKCKTCGKLFSDEAGTTEISNPVGIPATGHSYGAVTYTWSTDNQKCTAERKCTVCDDVESETAAATVQVVQEKSCTLPELTIYSATFKNDAFSSQKKESVQTADAVGHDLEKAEKKDASCTEAGYETYWKCKTCKKLFSDEAGTEEISNPKEIKATGHNLKKVEKQAATAAKEGNSTYWFCDTCNKYFSDKKAENEIKKEDTVLVKLAPVIIKGDGVTVTEGAKKTLSFTSDAAYEDFIRVEVDGKAIDEKNYTVKSGSTIVTLKEDYVAGLSEGRHTLGIVSESGTATAHFTVSKKATETETTSAKTTKSSPQTGDSAELQLYLLLMIASIGVVAGVGVQRKLKTRR